MSDKLILILSAVILIGGGSSASVGRGRQTDDCTSGFMSLDRIEAVLGNTGSTDHGLGTVEMSLQDTSAQVIVPDMNFTCDGSILSWTFGAQWEGHSSQYTELQIWRSSGNSSYTKVGNTTIMFEEENATQLYQYTLTSPLPFQAGDILGYFQGSTFTSQLALLYESIISAPQTYYTAQNSSTSEFNVGPSMLSGGYHVLISVETDSAGCDCGFMSVERMRILLGLEVVGNRTTRSRRQQITPDINFTCDGLITKWMIGGVLDISRNVYPELQVWRNIGNETYQKINGTFINIALESQTSIFEYEDFSPIPFLAGDILGMFQPPGAFNRLRVRSENNRGPTNYFVRTSSSATESPFNTIDLQSVQSQVYHPLVTVEILVNSSPTISNSMMTSTLRDTNTADASQSTTNLFATFLASSRTPSITKSLATISNSMMTSSTLRDTNTADASQSTTNLFATFLASSRTPSITKSLAPSPTSFSSQLVVTSSLTGTRTATFPQLTTNISATSFTSTLLPSPSSSHALSLMSSFSSKSLAPFLTNFSSLLVVTSSLTGTSTATFPQLTTNISATSFTSTLLPPPNSSHASSYMSSFSSLLIVSSTSSKSTDVILSPSFSFVLSTAFNSEITSNVQSDGAMPQQPQPSSNSSTGDNMKVESQLSLGIGIGGGVGGAVVLLSMIVILVGLVLVLRSRTKSKVELRHNGGGMANPVYSDTVAMSSSTPLHSLHYTKRPAQEEALYDSPSKGAYEVVDQVPSSSPHNLKDVETDVEFDNPLYSDTGPVTFTQSNVYESTEFGGSSAVGDYCYVPTTRQRGLQEQEADTNIYYSPTTVTSNGNKGYFAEEDIYWAPASNITDLYEQLAQHKYREIPRHQVKSGESLGSGQFGVVSRGKWESEMGQFDVAIKILKGGTSEEDRVKFLQEAAINGQFRHPNVVQLHGVVTVGEPVMIVLEYVPNGDLRSFLHSLKSLPECPVNHDLPQLCLSFCQHVASGMDYLAGKDFVHRDLAARNILVSESRVCKIADFGMARDLDESNYYVSHGGKVPTKWTAPEALHYKKYSTASDVWSFGCLMYEIWSLGHKPFEGYTNSQVVNLVTEGYRLAPPPGCPRAIYKVMMACWHPEKANRPTFSALCKALCQDSTAVLGWSVEDSSTHHQATVLGAALEAGKDLYIEIQESYIQKQ